MKKERKINIINDFINELSLSFFDLRKNVLNEKLPLSKDKKKLKDFIEVINKEFNIVLNFKDFVKEPTINNVLNQIKKIAWKRHGEKAKKNIQFSVLKNINKPYPKNKTIHELFEEQVKKTPDNIALECDGKILTYVELNERSNQLARYLLRKINIKKNDVVAVAFDNSIEAIFSVIAILKAGAAYLAIDSSSPVDRINLIIEEVGCKILITDKQFHDKAFGKVSCEILDINKIDSEIKKQKKDNLKLKYSSNDLACVVYTSGSTGVPKGIMLKHRAVVNCVFYQHSIEQDGEIFPNERTVLTQISSISYVISIHQIFLLLFRGAKNIIVPRKRLLDGSSFFELLIKNQVNFLLLTPSYFKLIESSLLANLNLLSLRYLAFGGETLSYDHLKNFDKFRGLVFLNLYGSSECSTYSFLNEIRSKNDISIGSPINNIEAYVLDENMKILPAGVLGELYISGDCLSEGYINNKKKTEEVFLDHPFAKGKKIYKTGDLARLNKKDKVEILGRIDHQIKIRGQRVEPGEIETNIKQFNDEVIVDVVVMYKKKLIAYYVTKNQKKISIENLKNYLKEKFQDYMIPDLFVQLEMMPLNQHGKLDRGKLLDIKEDVANHNNSNILNRENLEKKLFEIWKNVLGISSFGVNDSFFDLGGTSVKMLEVHSRINKFFPNEISLVEFFMDPTISGVLDSLCDKKNN